MVVEKRNPIPVKEAIQRIVNQQSTMPAITVALEKSTKSYFSRRYCSYL